VISTSVQDVMNDTMTMPHRTDDLNKFINCLSLNI